MARNALIIVATLGVMAFAAHGDGLALGDNSPAWKDLPGVDGKKHSLAELADRRAVLVVFYANHCPDCGLYLDRILSVARDYAAKGLATVLVSVSSKEEDKLPAMTKFAKEKNLPCLYLHDASQALGKQLGAEFTPEAYLFDVKRRLVYKGGIDDHWNADKVKRQHLRLAIDETLVGKPVTVPESDPHGCVIEYEE